MSLDGSTLPPSSQQWLPKTSLLSPNARQGSSVEGTQDAIISHSPGSYSTHRPTHFQVEEVPPPGKRPFGWTICYRGTTAALVGRWVIFQEGPIPARSSSRAGDTCLMKPRMLHTHPAAIAWVLRCFTCPGRAEPPSHRASLKTTSKETWGERRKLSLMEGETLELFHAAGSTSITRWECCTPGEPFAELSAQGGSGATAENSPAVYFSFRSPVPLPGINA